jgi:hypothetical protein
VRKSPPTALRRIAAPSQSTKRTSKQEPLRMTMPSTTGTAAVPEADISSTMDDDLPNVKLTRSNEERRGMKKNKRAEDSVAAVVQGWDLVLLKQQLGKPLSLFARIPLRPQSGCAIKEKNGGLMARRREEGGRLASLQGPCCMCSRAAGQTSPSPQLGLVRSRKREKRRTHSCFG